MASPARPPRRGGLSIAQVAARTGIAPSTLRFYEREMPGLFLIRKTAGGHRRYAEEDVARFTAIRRLTETDAVPLSEVRRILASRGDHEPLREDVARLRRAREEDAWTVADLARRLEALEARVASLAGSGKRGWFGKK